MPDVVVLLPGILGSVLKKNGQTVWGFSGRAIAKGLLFRGRSILEDLALFEDPLDAEQLDDGVSAVSLVQDLHLLPGLWKIDGYTRVIETLESELELWPGKNFFTFPYDWRRANQVAARRLARAVRDWLHAWRRDYNPDARLILIAHSMGGLVARYFLEVLEGWRDTRALITFGTPYRGSLNALNTLANGVRVGPMAFRQITELARNLTSVYQLLPIYPCYDPGDGELVRVAEAHDIPHVERQASAAALAFHREIEAAVEAHRQDEAYLTDGYRLFPIVGIHQSTLQSARAAGQAVEMATTRAGKDPSGDGTVPRPSAVPIEHSATGREFFAATKHGSLQNSAPVLTQLLGILSGLDLGLGEFRGEQESVASWRGERVAVRLEVDDLYWEGEPVRIRAQASGRTHQELTLRLASEHAPPETRALEARADGWLTASLEGLTAGTYRVELTGGETVEPATDSFVVARMEDERD